eukprot:GEMP01023649.1.p1 GENE.GEMP01023649.1~~GEMP01023649.1.p1  ORF type:complete len:352 (+),score=47.85 GEMP01023649.1:143-1198(+)
MVGVSAASAVAHTNASSSTCLARTLTRTELFHKIVAAIESGDEFVRKQALEPGGFRDAELRRQAWKFLLGVSKASPLSMSKAPRDINQRSIIEVDVLRSCFSWDVHFHGVFRKSKRESLRESLLALICHFFDRHPDYSYFQGFHDLCLVFLEAPKATRQQALPMVEAYACRLGDLFVQGFEQSLFPLLDKLRAIVARECPELDAHFLRLDFQYHFAVSWVLTHFAHVLPRLGQVARLFDVLIAQDSPMTALYFGAALVLRHKSALLALDDPCEQHAFWSNKEMWEGLDEEAWVVEAIDLQTRHPPHVLVVPAQSAISAGFARSRLVWSSVLRRGFPLIILTTALWVASYRV